MNKTTILAISAAVACFAAEVNATTISGNIDFTGYNSTLNNTYAGTATGLTSWGSVTTGGGSGILAGDDSLAATFSTPWSFSSGALNPFVTFDGFTFALTSSTILSQVEVGGFGFVNVYGTGVLSGNGYNATPYDFSFTTSGFGASTPGDQQFSAALSLAVPDGGTTVALLGGALTMLGLVRRKLVA